MKPRDDQPGERAAFAHQNHDVACRGASIAALRESIPLIQPRFYLIRDRIGHAPLGRGQPGFLALLLDRFGIVAILGADRGPQGNAPRPALARMAHLARFHPHRLGTQLRNRAIDEIEDRLRAAEIALQPELFERTERHHRPIAGFVRQFARIGDGGVDPRVVFLALVREQARLGALKAEDRLLVIADHEHGAKPIARRAKPVEIVLRQRIDDRPLAGIGILRLVDEDVIERPVELVADPLGHFRIAEQGGGARDLVVEIDQPATALHLVPPQREPPPEFEGGGEIFRQCQQRELFANTLATGPHRLDMALVGRVALCQMVEVLGLRAVRDEQRAVEAAQSRKPLRRIACEPRVDRLRTFAPALGVPIAQRREAGVERCGIERTVRTILCQLGLIEIARQAEKLQHLRTHRALPTRAPFPQFARLGAGDQPGLRAIGRQLARQHGERAAIILVRMHNQIGQHFASEQRARTVVHRDRARLQPRFLGKGGEQILRESVDRIDPQPTARTIENLGEQRACPSLRLRIELRADRAQLGRQSVGLHPHPARQRLVDARRHFGGARLGKGEAQDRARLDTGLQ